MHASMWRLGFAAALAVTLACSRTPSLDGAKVEIPVFGPSSLDDESTATTSDDLHDIGKYRTHSWYLSTAMPWEEVDAFYREKLAQAKREDAPDEHPVVLYTWEPPGWTGGAKIMVSIQKQAANGRTKFDVMQDQLAH